MESIFIFEHPSYLWYLLLIPALVLGFVLAGMMRKKAIEKFGSIGILSQLMPEYSTSRPVIKAVLLTLVVLFIVFGLANPQVGTKLETVKREGVELVIALDVSNSMLAEDIKPNRIDNAKQAIAQLIKKLHNDKIGLIVFAGQAYTQLPITTDYNAAKMFLRGINTSIVPIQGTAIGAAIELGMKSFSEDDLKNKALIVISDGENHEDDAIEQAKMALEKGISVHTIGMGSPDGKPIPIYGNYGQRDFRKDKEGNVVVTKLNESMLGEIAAAGGGVYLRATTSNTGLNLLFEKINELEKEEFETTKFSDYESRFQLLLVLALIFLALDFLVLRRKNKWLSKFNLFKV